MPRKPGHRQGVPRYRRPGQITLMPLGRLLHPSYKVWPSVGVPNQEAVDACPLCEDRCTGACDDEVDG